MLLRNKDTYEEFHAPSGIAKALIATGTVEEVLPASVIGPELEVRWFASRGTFLEDYLCPPSVSWTGGGNSGVHASTDGTSHLKCKSYVPGLRQQTCPQHIAEEYLRLYAEWSAKTKKRRPSAVVEKVSAATPKIPGIGAISGKPLIPWNQNVEMRHR